MRAVVAELEGNRVIPRHFIKETSTGLRKGALTEVSEALPAVTHVLNQARRFSKTCTRNIYVSIGTAQVKTQHSRGIVAVSHSDAEIYQDDIDRAIKASQAVSIGQNRMIIHNVTCEFIVDGVSDISDPLGLSGNRIEVNSLIIDAFAPHVKLLMKLVETAGGRIGGLIFSPIAAARSVLTKSQKDLGVVLIDIGAGTTGIAIYEENKLVGTAKFPVGAANISNDIAIGLKIPVGIAEQLKLHFGYAIAKEVGQKESFDLKQLYPDGRGMVSRRFLADIIESRLSEVFDFVNNEIKTLGKFGQLAGGAVLVGGGAKLPGITDLAKQELKLSTHIGAAVAEDWALETGGMEEYMEDPEFATALGLVLLAADKEGVSPSRFPRLNPRELFRFFMP